MAERSTKKPVKPRKRPVQSRSVATVHAILGAAARILERRGPDGYNTNDVASLAGVSIGSLYQYFPNKDSITGALICREMNALLEAVAAIDVSAPGRLDRLIDAAVDHQMRRPELARFLDLEEERLPLDRELAPVRAKISDIIRRCIDGFRPDAPDDDHAVRDVVDIIKGMVDGAGRRQEKDRDALARRVRRAVLGYLQFESPGSFCCRTASRKPVPAQTSSPRRTIRRTRGQT